MIQLRLFGGLHVTTANAELKGRATQKKPLALLGLLATAAPAGITRDKLVAYLWADAESEAARHRLAAVAYDLRRVLGEEAIVSIGDELRLAAGYFECDVVAFKDALGRDDPVRAARLYSGPFLDGFFVKNAPEFERWVDEQREDYARAQARVLERLARAASDRGDHDASARWWTELTRHDAYSSSAVVGLMESLRAAGDPVSALRAGERYAELLRAQLELEPADEVRKRIEELRAELAVQPGARPARAWRQSVWPYAHERALRRTHVPAALTAGFVALLAGWMHARSPQPAATARAPDPAAHALYMRGRIEWNKRTQEGLSRAVELFRDATERDPTFAQAYAGLADAYVLLGYLGFFAPDKMFAKGRAAAERGLELDDTMAEAYTSLGMILYWERDFPGAEAEFQQAIAQRPGYATARQWYALLLMALGRVPEMVEQSTIAITLDPLSLQINNTHGMVLFYAGDTLGAVKHYQRVISEEPDSAWVHANPWLLSNAGRVFAAAGRHREAVQLIERSLSVVPRHPRPLADLSYSYARMGRIEQARAAFEAADLANPQYTFFHAIVHACLSQEDSAFRELARIQQWTPNMLSELALNPLFDVLRSDPRYRQLLIKLKLSRPIQEPAADRPADRRDPRNLRSAE